MRHLSLGCEKYINLFPIQDFYLLDKSDENYLLNTIYNWIEFEFYINVGLNVNTSYSYITNASKVSMFGCIRRFFLLGIQMNNILVHQLCRVCRVLEEKMAQSIVGRSYHCLHYVIPVPKHFCILYYSFCAIGSLGSTIFDVIIIFIVILYTKIYSTLMYIIFGQQLRE